MRKGDLPLAPSNGRRGTLLRSPQPLRWARRNGHEPLKRRLELFPVVRAVKPVSWLGTPPAQEGLLRLGRALPAKQNRDRSIAKIS